MARRSTGSMFRLSISDNQTWPCVAFRGQNRRPGCGSYRPFVHSLRSFATGCFRQVRKHVSFVRHVRSVELFASLVRVFLWARPRRGRWQADTFRSGLNLFRSMRFDRLEPGSMFRLNMFSGQIVERVSKMSNRGSLQRRKAWVQVGVLTEQCSPQL